jgi:FkbM family methyltransferase
MTMRHSPKILVCGMPRSMTTWVFNVLRELISPLQIKTLWIEPGSQEERAFSSCEEPVLAKCHHFSDQLAEAADMVIYSYRDLRTAAVSYHRKFGSPCTREQVDGWINAARAWLPRADIVLQYESIELLLLDTIAKLRMLLANMIDSDCLDTSADEDILRRVDIQFSQKQMSAQISYDSQTMILPGHRTYQPDPTHLSPEEKTIFDHIEREFMSWLADFGYIHSSDHGQGLDYRIATTFLKTFMMPTVVDVGAERGSFTQLAQDVGAARIVCFEPLPRHFQYLVQRYDKVDQIKVHPLAISSRSGFAKLHIATDLAGNELDFHHTLDDLGDSATVIRSMRSLEVETATLSDLADKAIIPSDIHFLKIDTDGHDLSVLKGLGNLRPRVIMAEYWDTLPETSGKNPYQLADLTDWAVAHDYTRMIVIRRHGRLELIELDAPWTLAGDWGNVFFIRRDFELSDILGELNRLSKESYVSLCGYISSLVKECEAKEAEIRHLDAALQQLRSGATTPDAISQMKAAYLTEVHAAFNEKERVFQKQITAISIALAEVQAALAETQAALSKSEAALALNEQSLSDAQAYLCEKEEVIRQLAKAVFAYRLAHKILSPGAFFKKKIQFNSAIQIFAGILAPRLGNLCQHSPVSLRFPGRYVPVTPAVDLPMISIVTPSLSQGLFIERTLQSVLEQDYPNLEYFVQDCCSTDETIGILKEYEDRLSGYQSCPDNGQSHAINLGFANTTGEIMAWLNSDDLLLPGSLAFIGDFFARHPKVDVIYGNRILVDENDLEIGRWILPGHDSEVLSWADYVPQETLFWRRSIWEKVGGQVDESFRFAMDWDLLIRFREAGARFVHIPRFQGAFRVHIQQKTSSVINSVGNLEMNRIRQRILGYVPDQREINKVIGPFLMRHVMMDLFFRIRRRLGFQV